MIVSDLPLLQSLKACFTLTTDNGILSRHAGLLIDVERFTLTTNKGILRLQYDGSGFTFPTILLV
jgi:hypothetical protein